MSATNPASGEQRRAVPPADRGEERGVDEQVDLRVEVPPERARAAGEARELAVGVVEERLELDENRCRDERAAADLHCARDACGSGRENDRGRRHAQPREDDDERMRERPEHRLAEELVAVPPLPRAGERLRPQRCPRRSG